MKPAGISRSFTVAALLAAAGFAVSAFIIWDTAVHRSGGEWRGINVAGAAAIDIPIASVVTLLALRRGGPARRALLLAALLLALMPFAVELTRRLSDRYGATGSLLRRD